ncbi:Autophagy protein 5-like protein [Drosera capensis]
MFNLYGKEINMPKPLTGTRYIFLPHRSSQIGFLEDPQWSLGFHSPYTKSRRIQLEVSRNRSIRANSTKIKTQWRNSWTLEITCGKARFRFRFISTSPRLPRSLLLLPFWFALVLIELMIMLSAFLVSFEYDFDSVEVVNRILGVLAPRIGYLPLLALQIKPVFSAALPPGTDTVWFEYKGSPLKWYIPTGVLFDLLCAEPERPWNITVHFRGYPTNVLTPCESEDAIKWSFINSFKEAACIIAGNCKSVMNMPQSDQLDLWRAVLNGTCLPLRFSSIASLLCFFTFSWYAVASFLIFSYLQLLTDSLTRSLEVYRLVSSQLKLGAMDDEYITKLDPSLKITRIADDSESPAPSKTGDSLDDHPTCILD